MQRERKMMTEHTAKMTLYAQLIEAEKWNNQSTGFHLHSLKSMWYENDESIVFVKKGSVTDISYPDGHIDRFQNGKLVYTFGKKLQGKELLEVFRNRV